MSSTCAAAWTPVRSLRTLCQALALSNGWDGEMIELARGHKHGLPVANPVLLAAGTVGYGETLPRGLDLAQLGGVVIGPVMANSQGGSAPPRVAESPGGLVVEQGGQNRGLAATLRRFAKLWPRLGCPVVAQVADVDARGMGKVAAALAEAQGIGGLELLPLTTDRDEAVRMVKTVARQADLPIWVKVRLEVAETWASTLAAAGAHGLVIGQPPRGQLVTGSAPPWDAIGTHTGIPVDGALYGPLTFGLMLPVLRAVAQLKLPVALIACGGIHTPVQLHQALAAGADAVQVESAVWVEPALPTWLVGAWLSRTDGETTA